jgi:hypothetical protein
MQIQITEIEAKELVRKRIELSGDVKIEISSDIHETTSLTKMENAVANKIWLIKLIRQVSQDIHSGGLPIYGNSTSLSDTKTYVEKYIAKNCS